MMNTLKPISILLAEDNQDHAELMIDTLEEFNIKNSITHVSNGEQVVSYIFKQAPYENDDSPPPDIILLDIKMPRMDGVTTLEVLKNDEKIKHIPVIMISTSTTDSEIRRCYELGASSYIAKPLQFEDFSRKIKELNLYWVLASVLPPVEVNRQ